MEQKQTEPIAFFAHGTPAPKGSMKGFVVKSKTTGKNRAVVVPDSKRSKPWMAIVNFAAAEAMRLGGHIAFQDAPLEILITFQIQRPGFHSNKKGVKSSAPLFPATKPDIDKLTRAVLDAIEGVCFDNDSRVVSLVARKRYADPDYPVGVGVTIGQRVTPW